MRQFAKSAAGIFQGTVFNGYFYADSKKVEIKSVKCKTFGKLWELSEKLAPIIFHFFTIEVVSKM